jgi:molybdate transport system substrate-binding protein
MASRLVSANAWFEHNKSICTSAGRVKQQSALAPDDQHPMHNKTRRAVRLMTRNPLLRIPGSAVILILALAATACGGAIASNTSPGTQPASAPLSKPPSTTTAATTAARADVLQGVTLNVSAASSLTDVLKAIDKAFVAQNPNIAVTPNFASSGTLQTQIENGAPADVFISAAAVQMDNLQKKGLLIDETRKDLLNNRVVLVVPSDSSLGLTSLSDLALDKVKRIAIGDPKSVPAGTYAIQAFDQLGITASVQPKEVLGADARQVLTYVESGNVDAGIVYSTDALTSNKVRVAATAPPEINAKVVYPVAVVKASKVPDAAKGYIDFLFGTQAKALFEKYGFTVVAR